MIDLEIEIKELGRKHPTNAHNKISLIQTSHICHRCCAAGRNRHMEEYKHTHTWVWKDGAITVPTTTTTIKKTESTIDIAEQKEKQYIWF